MGAVPPTGRTQVALVDQTAFSCGSQAGRLCHPEPPGKRGELTAARTSRRLSGAVRKRASQAMPSRGMATNVAVQWPSRMIPGRLLRAGATPDGRMNVAISPGSRGTIASDSSLPSASGFTVNDATDAGAAPSAGPAARKTNGKLYLPQGMLAGADSPATGIHSPGASAARSRPGSTEAISHVADAAPSSWRARA